MMPIDLPTDETSSRRTDVACGSYGNRYSDAMHGQQPFRHPRPGHGRGAFDVHS